MKQKRTIEITIASAVAILFGASVVLAQSNSASHDAIVQKEINSDKEIKKLNAQIEERSAEIESLTERLVLYEQNVLEKQQEQASLENQISVIEDKIGEGETKIEKASIELEVLQLELEELEDTIVTTEQSIDITKEQLVGLIRQIHRFDQKTPLEITFTNACFSEIFSDASNVSRLRSEVQQSVDNLQESKFALEQRQDEAKDQRSEVSSQRAQLEAQQIELGGQVDYKEQLLVETEQSEEQFQTLLEQARAEQNEVESNIASLEKNVQNKIATIRADVESRLENKQTTTEELTEEEITVLSGDTTFVWPTAHRYISCGYHCAGYPFQSIFQHSGLDIPMPQGTPVAAAASGYVSIAKFDGTTNFAYIVITSPNGFSHMYGHVSGVNVTRDQYVRQGQIIGWSGGAPATPGAGFYSTGSHLHFEIRVDGIPVDPLPYLP